MLKTACSQYFFFALLLVAIVPSTAWTENERVETRTVRFEEIRSTGDDVTVELDLDQPIRLESWNGVIVDTVRLGLERTSDEGRASVAFGMALLAGEDVALRHPPVVLFSTDLPNVSTTGYGSNAPSISRSYHRSAL